MVERVEHAVREREDGLVPLPAEQRRQLAKVRASVQVRARRGAAVLILVELDDNALGDDDKLFEDNDVRIVVDKKSFLYLVGTTLEYSGGLNGKGFVFNNPNANRTCGCGESFSL